VIESVLLNKDGEERHYKSEEAHNGEDAAV